MFLVCESMRRQRDQALGRKEPGRFKAWQLLAGAMVVAAFFGLLFYAAQVGW